MCTWQLEILALHQMSQFPVRRGLSQQEKNYRKERPLPATDATIHVAADHICGQNFNTGFGNTSASVIENALEACAEVYLFPLLLLGCCERPQLGGKSNRHLV